MTNTEKRLASAEERLAAIEKQLTERERRESDGLACHTNTHYLKRAKTIRACRNMGKNYFEVWMTCARCGMQWWDLVRADKRGLGDLWRLATQDIHSD